MEKVPKREDIEQELKELKKILRDATEALRVEEGGTPSANPAGSETIRVTPPIEPTGPVARKTSKMRRWGLTAATALGIGAGGYGLYKSGEKFGLIGGDEETKSASKKAGKRIAGKIEIARTVTGIGGVKIEFEKSGYTIAVESISRIIGLDNPKLSRAEVILKFGVNRIANGIILQEGAPADSTNPGHIEYRGLPGQINTGRRFAAYKTRADGEEALRQIIRNGYGRGESFEDFINEYTYGGQNVQLARNTGKNLIDLVQQPTPPLLNIPIKPGTQEKPSPLENPSITKTPTPGTLPELSEPERQELIKQSGFKEEKEGEQTVWTQTMKNGITIKIYQNGIIKRYSKSGKFLGSEFMTEDALKIYQSTGFKGIRLANTEELKKIIEEKIEEAKKKAQKK